MAVIQGREQGQLHTGILVKHVYTGLYLHKLLTFSINSHRFLFWTLVSKWYILVCTEMLKYEEVQMGVGVKGGM